MRTKTLLLFVFLLTGMAFSQQEGTGRISFKKITQALTMGSERTMMINLKMWGYEKVSLIRYKKGSEEFNIQLEPDGKNSFYQEENASSERRDEIRTQAKNAGLKERNSDPSHRDIFLEGNGFSVSIESVRGITIKRLK